MPIKTARTSFLNNNDAVTGEAKRDMGIDMEIAAGHGPKRAVLEKAVLSVAVSILFFTFTRQESEV